MRLVVLYYSRNLKWLCYWTRLSTRLFSHFSTTVVAGPLNPRLPFFSPPTALFFRHRGELKTYRRSTGNLVGCLVVRPIGWSLTERNVDVKIDNEQNHWFSSRTSDGAASSKGEWAGMSVDGGTGQSLRWRTERSRQSTVDRPRAQYQRWPLTVSLPWPCPRHRHRQATYLSLSSNVVVTLTTSSMRGAAN